MNICFITGSFLPEVAGVPTHLFHLAGHFSKQGHQVLILCPDYSIVSELYPDYGKYRGEIFPNVTVRPVPTQKNRIKPESVDFQDGAAWCLEEYIGDFKPDIIQVEDPDRIYGLGLFGLGAELAYNDAIGIAYARANNIPVIGFYQSNFPAFADCYLPKNVPTPYRMDPEGVYEKIYGRYDEVLCSCEDANRYLESHGLKKVRQGVYMGIDESVFGSDEISELIVRDNKVNILYSGRFDGGKDVNLVIGIFKKAYEVNSGIRLILAGTGLFKETMSYVRKECEENPDIVYAGKLDRKELVKVYNSVDIYFSPHNSDTFGLSVIEAMSRGLPVIVSDRGGPASFVDNGVNGLLCADEDDFARQILTLSGDEARRKAMGRNAKTAVRKYHGSNCAANLIGTYQELIGRMRKDAV